MQSLVSVRDAATRRLHRLVETTHLVTYFSDEPTDALMALGLRKSAGSRLHRSNPPTRLVRGGAQFVRSSTGRMAIGSGGTMTTMSHYSRVLKVVIDAPSDLHDQELAFWQGAVGQELPEVYSAEYHGAFLHGSGLMLLMQRLESGGPRIHLDIHTDDVDAEVARLERLGANRVQKVETWWVMRDPAGLPFCVLPVGPGSLNDDNARRWE